MRYIKNIVLIVLLVVMLSVTGITILDAQSDIESSSNSGYMTEFDYIIKSPSPKQIDAFKGNASVDKIVPCYNQRFRKNMQNVNFLLTPDMTNINIGFFNDKNLVDGKFDENGLMLDETAAKLYNVKVGDELSIKLGTSSFKYKVSAIYLPTSYRNFDTGVMLAKYTDAINEAYSGKLVYSMAFIKAKDAKACDTMLNNYFPEAVLMTQDDYVASYKANNLCPPNVTDEEWTASIIVAYNQYVEDFYSRKDKDAVQAKSEYLLEVDDIVTTKQKKITATVIGVAIGSVVLYMLAGVLFTFINKKNVIDRYRDGEPLLVVKEVLIHVFSVVIIALLSFAIMKIATVNMFNFDSFIAIICTLSFSILASLIVVVPINYVVTRNAIAINKKHTSSFYDNDDNPNNHCGQMHKNQPCTTDAYHKTYRSDVNPNIIIKEFNDRFEVYKEMPYGLEYIETKKK